jgi:chromosome segregation ATPase
VRSIKELDDQIHELQSQQQACNTRLQQCDVENTQVESDLRIKELTRREKERKIQELLRDYEYAKDRETVLLVDR